MVFRQLESLTAADQGQLDQLRQRIRHYGRVCVAYSGGVDSALVAAIAQEQLAEAALAVTGISPALALTCVKKPGCKPNGWASPTRR